MQDITRTSSCKCGLVRFQAKGAPILTGVCYCNDCQDGARRIEALPKAPKVLDDDAGCSYLTYRDDRFHCTQGAEHLKGYKLKDKSPTTRFVATCCNSAIYLKYKHGHWVSTYRNRFADDNLPPIEMRTNTRRRDNRLPYPDDAPTYKRFPLALFGRLIKARIDMARGR